MEILLTLVFITFLVIAVGNLIGLKGKVIAIATVIIDILSIVVIAFTVDLTPILEGFLNWASKLADLFVKEITK